MQRGARSPLSFSPVFRALSAGSSAAGGGFASSCARPFAEPGPQSLRPKPLPLRPSDSLCSSPPWKSPRKSKTRYAGRSAISRTRSACTRLASAFVSSYKETYARHFVALCDAFPPSRNCLQTMSNSHVYTCFVCFAFRNGSRAREKTKT